MSLRAVRLRIAAAAAVGTTVLALWLMTGVSVADAMRFAAYEAAFVLVPGILALLALTRRSWGMLSTVVLGWNLGYALELAGFAATAALDVRKLFPIWPALVIGAATVVLWRRSGRRQLWRPDALGGGPTWLLAGGCIAGLVYLTFSYFSQAPLPGETEVVAYFPDFAWNLSYAAEAKHHWPLTNPSVAGVALHYHTFGHMHMGAVSQVTGVELSVVMFRLVFATQFVLLALTLADLARRLGHSAWVAPVAVILFFCAGEPDLDPDRVAPFAGPLIRGVILSPSFLFAFPLFLAAVALVYDRLEDAKRFDRGHWIVLALLLLAAYGAKAATLPVMAGALGLMLAWRLVANRRLDVHVLKLFGLVLAVLVAGFLLLYRGGGDNGLSLGLFTFVRASIVPDIVSPGGELGTVPRVLAGPFITAAMLLPLSGIVYLVAARRGRLGPGRLWLVGLLIVGVGAGVLFEHPGGSQLYFFYFAYGAAIPLSAEGFVLLGERYAGAARTVLVVAGGVLAVALATALVVFNADLAVRPAYAVLYGVVGAAVLAGTFALSRPRRLPLTAAAATALALATTVSLLDAPLDWVEDPAGRVLDGQPFSTTEIKPESRVMDRGLLAGLRWIRAHTPEDTVLAVNNHYALKGDKLSVFDYYPAFAERRVYLGSWLYAQRSLEIGYREVGAGLLPYPERLAVNDAAFKSPTPANLRRLSERGVDLLVADRRNGQPDHRLARIAAPLYENPSVAVYSLDQLARMPLLLGTVPATRPRNR